jgi:hypothetical protein
MIERCNKQWQTLQSISTPCFRSRISLSLIVPKWQPCQCKIPKSLFFSCTKNIEGRQTKLSTSLELIKCYISSSEIEIISWRYWLPDVKIWKWEGSRQMLRLLQFIVLKTGLCAFLSTNNVRTTCIFSIFDLGLISGEIGLPIVNLIYVQSRT